MPGPAWASTDAPSRAALQLSLRRGFESAKPFAEPRLAELPADERGFHPNASRHILEDETVAMQPNHHAQAAADARARRPSFVARSLEGGGESIPGPTCEAVDALVGFAVDGSLGNLFAVARPRTGVALAQFHLEGPGPGEEFLVVPSG